MSAQLEAQPETAVLEIAPETVKLAIKDLSGEPLILFSRSFDPVSYHQIEELFLNAGATLNVAYELEILLSVINFVAMGTGCGLLPDYARRVSVDGVVFKTLKAPNVVKTLAMVKRKGASELARTFFQFTADELGERRFDAKGRKVSSKDAC